MCDPKIPLGIWLLGKVPKSGWMRDNRLFLHRMFVLMITYVAYVLYHATRKPISVVKNELIDCAETSNVSVVIVCDSWINEMRNLTEPSAQRIEGTLDSTYLISYSIFMFASGIIAERVNLRYFLSLGMILAGLFTCLFGLGHFTDMHGIAYFIVIQFFAGALQTTGWPSVVTVVANWYGKGKKGLVFGIWNSHASVGNILGSVMAGRYVEYDWALSFIVPGCVLAAFGIFVFLFLVVKPEDVNLDPDNPNKESDEEIKEKIRPKHHEMHSLFIHNYSSDESDVDLASTDEENSDDEKTGARKVAEEEPISFLGALEIPGVVEFSLCLFFAKLVSYTFLFWLPTFIKETGKNITSERAAYLSIIFDIGGIVGGILAGLATDYYRKSATICAILLIVSVPVMVGYDRFGHFCPMDGMVYNECFFGIVFFMFTTGLLVNGPYSLITTAVAAELGTHPSLKGSSKALATVASVIDGTGSLGAAMGPFLAGAVGINWVFYMLIASDVLALCFLLRLVKNELWPTIEKLKRRKDSISS